MIQSPSTSDINGLCDWAELQAWVSPRGSCTLGDIIKYLEIDDATDEYYDDPDLRESEKDEAKANDVLGIALKRQQVLGKLYPFDIVGQQLKRLDQRRHPSPEFEAYLFYLALTGLVPSVISLHARHLFECEAMTVLKQYFGGECFHFGWTIVNANLGKAKKRVEAFCNATDNRWIPADDLAERVGDGNDLQIDTIHWKNLYDERENELLVLGQCASGHNWDKKLENSAVRLLSDCFSRVPTGPMITCFCTCVHIPDKNWRRSALRHNGLLFDRLRLVLQTLGSSGRVARRSTRKWLLSMLAKIPQAQWLV